MSKTAFDKTDVEAMQKFFISAELPKNGVKLSACETIMDVRKFVETHLQVITQNVSIATYNTYYNRLLALKHMIQKDKVVYVDCDDYTPYKPQAVKVTVAKPKPVKKRKK